MRLAFLLLLLLVIGRTTYAQSTLFEDSNRRVRLTLPEGWTAREQSVQNEDGSLSVIVLAHPVDARSHDINGYVSQGLRVYLDVPVRGQVWWIDQHEWAVEGIRDYEAQDFGFAVTDSNLVIVGDEFAHAYQMHGENEYAEGPSRLVVVYQARPRYTLTLQLIVPDARSADERQVFYGVLDTLEMVN
jgi:hypothetical protein